MSALAKALICLLYLIISIGGLTLVKLGNNEMMSAFFVVPVLNIKMSWCTFLGISLYGISFILYISIVSNMQFGRILPLLAGCANILALLVSLFLLKEDLSVKGIVGAVIVIIGVIVMNI